MIGASPSKGAGGKWKKKTPATPSKNGNDAMDDNSNGSNSNTGNNTAATTPKKHAQKRNSEDDAEATPSKKVKEVNLSIFSSVGFKGLAYHDQPLGDIDVGRSARIGWA